MSAEAEPIERQKPNAGTFAAWARPVCAGLIAGAAAVAALELFRPQVPPPRVWPELMRAAVDPDAPATRPLGRPAGLTPSAQIQLPAPPFAAGAGPALRAALDRRIDRFAADHLPADAAVRRWAEQSGANVAVNWPALETVGLDRAQPVTLDLRGVPAGQILRLLIDQVGVGAAPQVMMYADGDVLRVEPDDEDGPRHRARLVTRLYDVRPLVLDALRWQTLIRDDSRPGDLEERGRRRINLSAGGGGGPRDLAERFRRRPHRALLVRLADRAEHAGGAGAGGILPRRPGARPRDAPFDASVIAGGGSPGASAVDGSDRPSVLRQETGASASGYQSEAACPACCSRRGG